MQGASPTCCSLSWSEDTKRRLLAEFQRLCSNGRWVTAYITLPEGFDPATIDPATVAITGLDGVSCDPDYVQPIDPAFTPTLGDYDEDGFLDLTVKFDRQILSANLCLDDVAIRVEGDLVTGEHFAGEDLIRVIQRGRP